MRIRSIAEVYPQAPPDEALFDTCARACEEAGCSIEQTVRTLAFLIGSIITGNDLAEAERERLADLVAQDVAMILEVE